MRRRLTSLCGDCAEDVCVHRRCGGHISEGSVVQWVDVGGLAPLLMMQMCDPQCCFGRWLWMTPSQGPSSLPGGRWQSLSLASSCWWRTAREHETEKRSYLSVRCLHSFSSASFSSLCFWLVTNRCHGPPLWGSSPSFYHTFLYFLLRLFIFSFTVSMRLLSWNILSCDVDGSLLYVLKNIWESHFSSKRLRDSCSSCLMRCCFLLCSLQPPATLFHCQLCSALQIPFQQSP